MSDPAHPGPGRRIWGVRAVVLVEEATLVAVAQRFEMAHPNEETIRRLYDAFATGDVATVDQLLSEEVTWHAPGTAQHAGIRRGKSELFALMGRLAELTGGSLRSELVDVLANDGRAVVIQMTRGERRGRPPLEDREVIVYDLRDGRVVEVWEHPGDLLAMDAFFA